jgi:hypothetical protein
MKAMILVLALGLFGGAAFAGPSSNGFGSKEESEGGTAAGSLDVFKCVNCAESAFDRPRTFKANPAAYADSLLDTSKPVPQQGADSAI